MLVRFSEMNSGGFFRLTDEQWCVLSMYEWRIDYDHHNAFLYCRSVRAAIKMWEAITGLDHNTQGCPCCGFPYEFTDVSDYCVLL